MRKTLRVLFAGLLLLSLAACSARTRYTVNVDLIDFIPTVSGTLPAGTATLILPGEAGQSVPGIKDLVERARIEVRLELANTGAAPLIGNFELRLGPQNDANVNDNAGGDVALGSTAISIPPGQTQTPVIDLVLNPTTNTAAYEIVKGGPFKLAVKVNGASDGGTYALKRAFVSITGRPATLLQ